MDNNNYNNNLKNINDHMQLSQNDRQTHIDLATPCYGHIITKGRRKGQLSDNSKNVKNSLLEFHQIEDFKDYNIHTCHLCPNDTTMPNGFKCINPKHLYFGTASENMMDRPPEARKEGSRAGAMTRAKMPNSEKQKKTAGKTLSKISQEYITCPVCNFTGQGRSNMKRWHFDNCKFKS